MPGLAVWIHGIESVNLDNRARHLLFIVELNRYAKASHSGRGGIAKQ